MFRKSVIASGILWLAGWITFAQLPTATIMGVVKDSSGAVIPDAQLTARNQDTGQTRTALSAADGSYRFSALPVGNYEVQVEHPGFQTARRGGLNLSVGQEAVVNFSLDVGAIEQTVSVTAEAPLVNTTSGSLGGLVDEQRVADLPLNGRNYIDLTLLQPGIQQNKNMSTTLPAMTGVWFSSNGAPLRSNNYLLDGASMVSLLAGSSSSVSGSTLGVEGVREYRVVTNSFSAEYGMTMGSQMMIVSKGGTNNFHGSVFEYLRNSALDARNFFDYKTAASPRRLPPFVRNNFGASFGGPIQKDKTFFFGVFEGVRERLGITTISNTIPASAKVDGGLVAQISPVIRPLLALFPDPNLPNNRFTYPFSQPTDDNYGQMRVDRTFSAADTAFVRYTISDTDQVHPLAFPLFKQAPRNRSQFGTLSENHVFSPAVLNSFRFSFSRTNIVVLSPSGIIGPQFSFVPGNEIGTLTIGAVSAFGPDGTAPNVKKQNIFTWSDDVFYTRSRHSLKFGALINHYQQYMLSTSNHLGAISFANISSFLLAVPAQYVAVTPGSSLDKTYHNNTVGFYAQDDFRARSNLTFNVGLRYEFMTVPAEAHNQSAAVRDLRKDPDPTLGPVFKNPSLGNISPRFGFAWDVKGNGKMAVRGGFGLLYDVGNLASALSVGAANMPPFATTITIQSPPTLTIPLFLPAGAGARSLRPVDYHLSQSHMLQYNLTLERQLPADMAVTLAYAGSRGLDLIKSTEGNPTVPQVLPDGRQFWTGNEPRINPNWGTVQLLTAAGNSWYNSLQVGLTKRLTKGLQFQSSYTYSKVIDETQSQLNFEAITNAPVPVDPAHRQVDRAPASFDVTHNWRFNAIYHFPGAASAAGPGKLLNGWWVSGILSVQGGFPFTPALQTNRSRSKVNGGAASTDRPDLVPGRNNGNIIRGGPDLYYDPTAFTIPAAGFLGTAGRNILRAPGFATLDFSLVKDTALKSLKEGAKLEFRAEFFNVLNRANFTPPDRTVFAARADIEAPLPTAGRITQTTSSLRQIQLALKLLF